MRRCGPYFCLGKVVALEEERRGQLPGQGMEKAVAAIEGCAVSGALTRPSVGIEGNIRNARRDFRDDRQAGRPDSSAAGLLGARAVGAR